MRLVTSLAVVFHRCQTVLGNSMAFRQLKNRAWMVNHQYCGKMKRNEHAGKTLEPLLLVHGLEMPSAKRGHQRDKNRKTARSYFDR